MNATNAAILSGVKLFVPSSRSIEVEPQRDLANARSGRDQQEPCRVASHVIDTNSRRCGSCTGTNNVSKSSPEVVAVSYLAEVAAEDLSK